MDLTVILEKQFDMIFSFFHDVFRSFTAVDSAAKEIALWFKDEELVKWDPVAETWVYE